VLIGDPKEAKFGTTSDQLLEGYRKCKELGVKRFGLHAMVVSNCDLVQVKPKPILSARFFLFVFESSISSIRCLFALPFPVDHEYILLYIKICIYVHIYIYSFTAASCQHFCRTKSEV